MALKTVRALLIFIGCLVNAWANVVPVPIADEESGECERILGREGCYRFCALHDLLRKAGLFNPRNGPLRMTMLVPPDDDLLMLSAAYDAERLDLDSLADILSLHMLTEDYSVQQLLEASVSRDPKLYTLSNTEDTALHLASPTLALPSHGLPSTPVLVYNQESVRVEMQESDIVQCSMKAGARVVYHRVSGIFSPFSLDALREEFPVEEGDLATSDTTEAEEGQSFGSSQWSSSRVNSTRRQDSDGWVLKKGYALVMFVLVYMVLFGATVFVLRTLWRHGLCGARTRRRRCRRDSSESSKEKFTKQEELKLYRWDMHLWSMQPKPATDSPDPDANSDKVAEEQDSDGDRKPEKTDKADTEMHEAHEQADVVEHVDCARSACSDDCACAHGGNSCDLKADHACVICFENEGDHVLLNCGHGGYCGTCAYKVLSARSALCPVCRAELSAVGKVPLDTPVGALRVVTLYACTQKLKVSESNGRGGGARDPLGIEGGSSRAGGGVEGGSGNADAAPAASAAALNQDRANDAVAEEPSGQNFPESSAVEDFGAAREARDFELMRSLQHTRPSSADEPQELLRGRSAGYATRYPHRHRSLSQWEWADESFPRAAPRRSDAALGDGGVNGGVPGGVEMTSLDANAPSVEMANEALLGASSSGALRNPLFEETRNSWRNIHAIALKAQGAIAWSSADVADADVADADMADAESPKGMSESCVLQLPPSPHSRMHTMMPQQSSVHALAFSEDGVNSHLTSQSTVRGVHVLQQHCIAHNEEQLKVAQARSTQHQGGFSLGRESTGACPSSKPPHPPTSEPKDTAVCSPPQPLAHNLSPQHACEVVATSALRAADPATEPATDPPLPPTCTSSPPETLTDTDVSLKSAEYVMNGSVHAVHALTSASTNRGDIPLQTATSAVSDISNLNVDISEISFKDAQSDVSVTEHP